MNEHEARTMALEEANVEADARRVEILQHECTRCGAIPGVEPCLRRPRKDGRPYQPKLSVVDVSSSREPRERAPGPYRVAFHRERVAAWERARRANADSAGAGAVSASRVIGVTATGQAWPLRRVASRVGGPGISVRQESDIQISLKPAPEP